MPISSLPDVCFSNILSYLDGILYKCLFVNRYFCKFTIPLIWREPFISRRSINISLINTLLACLNEDEISSLIPCAINFNNNQYPLFEYGKFIRKFNHGFCVSHIITWLRLSLSLSYNGDQDCRIQKLVNVIYHMIMRHGSNLQELLIEGCFYLPKISTFTAYEPGITNLKSLQISFNYNIIDCENTVKFLNMVSKFCKHIVDCVLQLGSPFPESFVDVIKSQPLEKFSFYAYDVMHPYVTLYIQGEGKKIIYALEFRSETLKELSFEHLDFQDVDLSFMSKLDRLERLELINCRLYLFTKKLHLKELILYYDEGEWDYDYNELKITGAIINPLLSEELHTLDFRDIVTPEAIKAIRESCPNLKFLQISIDSDRFLSSTILPICEISSLRNLKINLQNYGVYKEVYSGPLIKMLGDNLKFVECLSIDCYIDLPPFQYFIDNCKANLKKWIIFINAYQNSRKDYLIHVSNYQEVHNSLKLLGIVENNVGITGNNAGITNEELEVMNLLKNQGVDVKFYEKVDLNYWKVF